MPGRLKFATNLLLTVCAVCLASSFTQGCATVEPDACADSPLLQQVRQQGTLRVVVQLAGDFPLEAGLSEVEVQERRRRIQEVQDELLSRLAGTDFQLVRRFDNLPLLALQVAENALCLLETSDLVESVALDDVDRPSD